MLDRGERVELLVDQTSKLNEQSYKFKKQSTALKNTMWWKNAKLWVILIIIVLVRSSYLLFFFYWRFCVLSLSLARAEMKQCDSLFRKGKKLTAFSQLIIFFIIVAACGGFQFPKCSSQPQ